MISRTGTGTLTGGLQLARRFYAMLLLTVSLLFRVADAAATRAACPPYCRRIFLNDRAITSLPDRFVTGIRRSTFGFVFHRLYLINGIFALENIVAPAYPNGEKSCLLRQRSLDLLAKIRSS